jgi:hypothetical protein
MTANPSASKVPSMPILWPEYSDHTNAMHHLKSRSRLYRYSSNDPYYAAGKPLGKCICRAFKR